VFGAGALKMPGSPLINTVINILYRKAIKAINDNAPEIAASNIYGMKFAIYMQQSAKHALQTHTIPINAPNRHQNKPQEKNIKKHILITF
jgi:hypothetical protein